VLAENLVTRSLEQGMRLEVWTVDRRGHQLEDRIGLDIAEASLDPQIGLDWLFGDELGLDLDPALVAGPNRRAQFHDPQQETAFMANWTNLVLSQDIDAIVDQALAWALDQNVFLGGHSAGTGFAARYAATDFDLPGTGPPAPGYTKLRGLVMLEGGAGSTAGDPPSDDTLDRVEDRADGGLFYAVRDDAPRCVDGTPCTVATEDVDCAGKGLGTCTEPTTAYAALDAGGLPFLNPRVLSAAEVVAIQGATDLEEGQMLLGVDQGGVIGNNAISRVGDLAAFGFLPPATVAGFGGTFLDDDSPLAVLLPAFLQGSLGAMGPEVGGLITWQAITQGPLPAEVFADNGPAPSSLPSAVWGVEKEVVRIDRLLNAFFLGESNFVDWYYPSAGPSTTSGLVSLDSTPLSVGRGRRDIENLTRAGSVDIPVLALGASNGLTPVAADYLPYAQSLAICAAPSCDGAPRVIDAGAPSEAFPTFGGAGGGFEVVISEGLSHLDMGVLEDDRNNRIYGPLMRFIERNLQ
jgi:pimeloyl-ACP methyl ester carboxylesterase